MINCLFLCLIVASLISGSFQTIIAVRGSEHYTFTYQQAYQACFDIGATLASPQDLEEARNNGYSNCGCGWLSDQSARFPMTYAVPGCGNRADLHQCTWRNTWNAFCFMGDPIGNCSRPLGMENGAISDYQLTSSSTYHTFWTERWDAKLARLNKGGVVNAWMPNNDGRNQYIEVDLLNPMAITGIITQGVKRYLKQQYVSSYKIAFSKDATYWVYYKEANSEPAILPGNSDNNGRVRNMFTQPILAQHLRIYPVTWFRHISLRFELLGCDLSTYDDALERRRNTNVISVAEEYTEREPPQQD